MRNHSHYDPHLIIGQLVNGMFWAIRNLILPVRIQIKEYWVLLNEFLFTLLYFDSYPHNFNKPTLDNHKQTFLVVVFVCKQPHN